MHTFTEVKFDRLAGSARVRPDVLERARATAERFYRPEWPTGQPAETGDGAVEVMYLVDGVSLSFLFGVERDPEDENDYEDIVIADTDDDILFCGPVDDPEIIRQAEELLTQMSEGVELVDLTEFIDD